jgi:hypothetical protein
MKFPLGSMKKERRPVEKLTSAFFLSAGKGKKEGEGGGEMV